MPCYRPIKAWRGELNENFKRPVVFKARDAVTNESKLEIACGECPGCRLERSRQWAIRCMHEKELHEDNCFVTLTYDDDHLPKGGSLNVEDIQKFFKKLRSRHEEKNIRYLQCGEYGENYNRPHHHAIVFGHDFRPVRRLANVPDKTAGNKENEVDELRDLWQHGYSMVGDVTFESCAYVARYVTKKMLGKEGQENYKNLGLKPEFITMSRRPGIGKKFFDKFKGDIYPQDHVILRGREMKPPKYYDKLYEIDNKEGYDILKAKRKEVSDEVKANNEPDRLKVRERLVIYKSENFAKRRLENGEVSSSDIRRES